MARQYDGLTDTGYANDATKAQYALHEHRAKQIETIGYFKGLFNLIQVKGSGLASMIPTISLEGHGSMTITRRSGVSLQQRYVGTIQPLPLSNRTYTQRVIRLNYFHNAQAKDVVDKLRQNQLIDTSEDFKLQIALAVGRMQDQLALEAIIAPVEQTKDNTVQDSDKRVLNSLPNRILYPDVVFTVSDVALASTYKKTFAVGDLEKIRHILAKRSIAIQDEGTCLTLTHNLLLHLRQDSSFTNAENLHNTQLASGLSLKKDFMYRGFKMIAVDDTVLPSVERDNIGVTAYSKTTTLREVICRKYNEGLEAKKYKAFAYESTDKSSNTIAKRVASVNAEEGAGTVKADDYVKIKVKEEDLVYVFTSQGLRKCQDPRVEKMMSAQLPQWSFADVDYFITSFGTLRIEDDRVLVFNIGGQASA